MSRKPDGHPDGAATHSLRVFAIEAVDSRGSVGPAALRGVPGAVTVPAPPIGSRCPGPGRPAGATRGESGFLPRIYGKKGAKEPVLGRGSRGRPPDPRDLGVRAAVPGGTRPPPVARCIVRPPIAPGACFGGSRIRCRPARSAARDAAGSRAAAVRERETPRTGSRCEVILITPLFTPVSSGLPRASPTGGRPGRGPFVTGSRVPPAVATARTGRGPGRRHLMVRKK